jgi:Flp pilus assembly protein protease CpaA
VNAAYEIATQLLRTMAVASIAYGIVILLGALLAGPTRPATAIRRRIAPGLNDPMWASAGTALLILLLVWWGPTPALQKPIGILLIAALLIIGVFALRRQTMREFPPPEADTEPLKPA